MLRRKWSAKFSSLDVVWSYYGRGTQCQSIDTYLQLGRRLPLTQARGIAAATSSLATAILSRARHITQEYESLLKQLGTIVDAKVGKKVKELSLTAQVMNEWEAAQTVS